MRGNGIDPVLLHLSVGVDKDVDGTLRRPPHTGRALHSAFEEIRLPRTRHSPRDEAGVGLLLNSLEIEWRAGDSEGRRIHLLRGHAYSRFDAREESPAYRLGKRSFI